MCILDTEPRKNPFLASCWTSISIPKARKYGPMGGLGLVRGVGRYSCIVFGALLQGVNDVFVPEGTRHNG